MKPNTEQKLPLSFFMILCNINRKETNNTFYREVSLLEQKVLILLEHLRSPTVSNGARAVQSLVFCVVFCRSLFVLFLLAIVLSVLLRCTTSDYPFGIFKLVFYI